MNYTKKILYILLLLLVSTINSQEIDTITKVNLDKNLSSEVATTKPVFVSPSYPVINEVYRIDDISNPKNGNSNSFISDPNNYISAKEELELNTLIWSIESATTAQIAVVILPSIGNEVPKSFAVKLFKKWGIGQADKDNGLLILTIMDQRRTEFETGYGLEPILTDAICYRIGKQEIVPHFKNGDFGKGLIASVKKVKLFLENPEAVKEIYSNGITYKEINHHSFGVWYYILLGYLLLGLILAITYYSIVYDVNKSINDYYAKYIRLEKVKTGFLMVLFPLPFIFINRIVKKRIKKYRYAPRFSRVNGMTLKLKDQWAENKFLHKAQILEEKIKSLEYDVWVTEDESDILVLEYKGALDKKYTDCKKCGYKTFSKTMTKVETRATYTRSGVRVIHYKCRNCNYKKKIKETIPQKIESSSSSSSFGGSSGGSSSFGGGSSGGGGAGVSW